MFFGMKEKREREKHENSLRARSTWLNENLRRSYHEPTSYESALRAFDFDKQGLQMQSVAEYTRSLNLYSDRWQCWANRSIALRRLGKIEWANLDLDRARELNPDLPEAVAHPVPIVYLERVDGPPLGVLKKLAFDENVTGSIGPPSAIEHAPATQLQGAMQHIEEIIGIEAATPEEKLAEIQRLSQELAGNAQAAGVIA